MKSIFSTSVRSANCAAAACIAICLATAVPANAASLTLEAPSLELYQQTNQNPCIIGDPSCSNPVDFDFTLLPAGGNITEYIDIMSPIYTIEQVVGVAMGTAFDIGIDVNTAQGASGPEILESFEVFVNGSVEFSFENGVDGSGVLNFAANGTGFSDARLLGIDLSGFQLTDEIQFKTTISRVSDGRENIFIISGDSPTTDIPEPASALLLLPGLLAARRIRRRS